jgi:ribosomal protein S25
VFRRFKRYIGLTLEPHLAEGAKAAAAIGLEDVKKAVTDEEVMHDMSKELDGIFMKQDQKQKAVELINRLATSKAYGFAVTDESQIVEHAMKQEDVSKRLEISEMAASRLLRELEQHGYIKRFTRPREFIGGEEKIVQLNW